MHTRVSFGEFVTLMWAIEADLIKKQKIFMGATSLDQKLAGQSRLSKYSHEKQHSVHTVEYQQNQRIIENYDEIASGNPKLDKRGQGKSVTNDYATINKPKIGLKSRLNSKHVPLGSDTQ